jgi:hypothetical protein
VKRRLAVALLPMTLGIGLLQSVPAHANDSPPPKVVVNATYPVCAGNYFVGRGLCIPWTL